MTLALDTLTVLRARVERSRERHRLAVAAVKRAVDERLRALTPEPDAVHDALREEQAARAELVEALLVFSDLVIHGRPLEDPISPTREGVR